MQMTMFGDNASSSTFTANIGDVTLSNEKKTEKVWTATAHRQSMRCLHIRAFIIIFPHTKSNILSFNYGMCVYIVFDLIFWRWRWRRGISSAWNRILPGDSYVNQAHPFEQTFRRDNGNRMKRKRQKRNEPTWHRRRVVNSYLFSDFSLCWMVCTHRISHRCTVAPMPMCPVWAHSNKRSSICPCVRQHQRCRSVWRLSVLFPSNKTFRYRVDGRRVYVRVLTFSAYTANQANETINFCPNRRIKQSFHLHGRENAAARH